MWTIAGLTIYATAITVGLTIMLTRPVIWLVANLGGYALVAVGWSPPLTDADLQRLADPERALFDDDDEHARSALLRPPPSADTPTPQPAALDSKGWVDPVERERARERAADARHERQTAALEALALQPATPREPTPTPAMTTAPQMSARPRQPVSGRQWVLRALIVLSLLSAAGLLVTAWTLAALSAAGTIGEPPTNDELIEGIHARTEQRANDIAEQFHINTEGATTP